MPAIITHDNFGKDVYQKVTEILGVSQDTTLAPKGQNSSLPAQTPGIPSTPEASSDRAVRDAFLLGNQGPDPLFYSVIFPSFMEYIHLGSLMHAEKPSELLFAFHQAVSFLSAAERPWGRAYVCGFVCHYVLDRAMHPLVFHHQYELCDCGVEGLDRSHAQEVHALIESEFDELVLFTKQKKTIANFDPHTEVLQGSEALLGAISKLYVYVALTVYGMAIPPKMFSSAVKAFRLIEGAFCSPSGLKRAILGGIEEIFKPYSFVRAMSPRNRETKTSIFANQEHAPWTNPFTQKASTAGFWDIFDQAQDTAVAAIAALSAPTFDLTDAKRLTQGLDFSGKPEGNPTDGSAPVEGVAPVDGAAAPGDTVIAGLTRNPSTTTTSKSLKAR